MSKSAHAGTAVAIVLSAFLATPAFADDWTAVKLRGTVMALVQGDWVKLERGVVIPGDQAIRTLRSGRVTFARGEEVIEVGPDTQIQIIDRAGYDKYTTVKQYFGRVAVEAEVRQVQHFAVQTPHLAAVVKGTRFVVVSGEEGATVEVERGAVAVEDTDDHSSVTVTAGQEVTASPGAVMEVSGTGELPVVVGANGKPMAKAAGFAGRSGNSANSSFNANPRSHEGGKGQGKGNAGNGDSGNKGNSGNGNSGNGGGNSGNGGGNSGNGGGNSGNGGGNSASNSGNGGGNNGRGNN